MSSGKSKQKKHIGAPHSSSVSTSYIVCSPFKPNDTLTVVITPALPDHKVRGLSRLQVSQALENLWLECIVEVRYKAKLNVIVVDTRNGQTTRSLISCTELCGMTVRVYGPLPRPFVPGIIRGVDLDLSDQSIADHLRSPEQPAGKLRRSRRTLKVKFLFGARRLGNVSSGALIPGASAAMCEILRF